jgi:hypothetical protein
MSRAIPGTRVEEFEQEAEAARAHAAELEIALERERRDAAELAPRQRAAVAAHRRACAEYERLRKEIPTALGRASDAIDELITARANLAEARRGLDRLGASPESVTPSPLHRTTEGRRALEGIRSRVLAGI